MNQIVIGTAGHIDHGKTALVKALTGIDTDKLAEEQKRGMTIDLGFAFLNDRITIIDVPGHERFIRNMVAGVSTIDFVILTIALDDGIMPQTMEHLHIIDLLGIPDGVVVLTKSDLIQDVQWVELVKDEIREKTKDTVLEGKPIIKTSVHKNEGITELHDLLTTLEGEKGKTHDDEIFRLQVDRVFQKTGYGLIVTGTVLSGVLKIGSMVGVQPSNQMGKVRGLQSHGAAVNVVSIGDRAAINLTGIELTQIWRGSELATPRSLHASNRAIVNINLIKTTKWKLKAQQRIRIHSGTSESLAKIIYIPKTIVAGESINAFLEFDKPVSIALDDRFILRTYSPMDTIGGGKILEIDPQGFWKNIKSQCQQLSVMKTERFVQFIHNSKNTPKSETYWADKFSKSRKLIHGWIESNHLIHENEMVFSKEGVDSSKKAMIKFITAFHKKNPYRGVINSESVRSELGFSRPWHDYIISNLDGKEITFQNGGLALKSHKMELKNQDKENMEKIKHIFSQMKFLPVSVKELTEKIQCGSEQILELLHILKRRGNSIDISDHLWMSQSDLDQLIDKLDDHYNSNEILSVGEFKSMTNLTRKTAIPLLEYLDKTGITFRRGNERIVGTKFPSKFQRI
jgi:selenocysteine-specific elongation factor